MANRFLDTNDFDTNVYYRMLSSIHYAAFDTFVVKIGRLFTLKWGFNAE